MKDWKIGRKIGVGIGFVDPSMRSEIDSRLKTRTQVNRIDDER